MWTSGPGLDHISSQKPVFQDQQAYAECHQSTNTKAIHEKRMPKIEPRTSGVVLLTRRGLSCISGWAGMLRHSSQQCMVLPSWFILFYPFLATGD